MFLDVPWIKRIDQKSPFRIGQTVVFFSIKSSLRQTRVLTRGFIRPTRFIIATLFFSWLLWNALSSMQSCVHAGKRKQHLDKILFTCDCFSSFWWKHQVSLTLFLMPKGVFPQSHLFFFREKSHHKLICQIRNVFTKCLLSNAVFNFCFSLNFTGDAHLTWESNLYSQLLLLSNDKCSLET